jgi:fused-like protein
LLIKHFSDAKNGQKKASADLMNSINQINMGDTVMAFLLNISSKTDLSPKGFNAMLSFIHDAIQNEYKTFMQKIFKNCLKLLCSLMRDN